MTERLAGGLWCSEVLERLDGFIDGALAVDELDAVQMHVAQCQQCASFGASYAAVVSALRGEETDAAAELDAERLERLRRVLVDR